jgi:hypothetical protein
MLFPEVPLNDIGVGVWCAVSAARIVEPIHIPEKINAYHNITFRHFLKPVR